MSPEIYVNNILIASVPDATGHYETINGETLEIEFDVSPEKAGKRITVKTQQLAGKPGRRTQDGRRELELSRLGIGSQKLPKGLVSVELHEPIFSSKRDRTERNRGISGSQRDSVSSAPVWIKGRGRR